MSTVGETLTVVPNHQFAQQGVRAGLITGDWVTVDELRTGMARGRYYKSWRYLNDLDSVPPRGATSAELGAWLERPEREGVGPGLDDDLRIQLDAMCMLNAP